MKRDEVGIVGGKAETETDYEQEEMLSELKCLSRCSIEFIDGLGNVREACSQGTQLLQRYPIHTQQPDQYD